MGVSKSRGTQQPWGFPAENHHFGCVLGDTTIFGNIHMVNDLLGPNPWLFAGLYYVVIRVLNVAHFGCFAGDCVKTSLGWNDFDRVKKDIHIPEKGNMDSKIPQRPKKISRHL